MKIYWLPAEDRGCNAVVLRRVDLSPSGAWSVELIPGTATPDGEGDPTGFTPDPDFPVWGATVRYPDHFTAWFEALVRTAETAEGHFVGGLLMYLWMQRHELLTGLPADPLALPNE